MIDWTDRSEDVLVRWEVVLYTKSHARDPKQWHDDSLQNLWQLMADLVTMVDHVSKIACNAQSAMSAIADGSNVQDYYPKDVRAFVMATARDETGARLFPDPAED